MKIVQFPNGKYAVRKFSILRLSYVYKDLLTPKLWWPKDCLYFRDCTTYNLEEVQQILSYGKPIK